MKKMRGVIDPLGLGLLIAIIGSTTAYFAHKDVQLNSAESTINLEQSGSANKQTDKQVMK